MDAVHVCVVDQDRSGATGTPFDLRPDGTVDTNAPSTPVADRAAPDTQGILLWTGVALVMLVMVAVVVDASAAYLRQSGLDSLADGAALAAHHDHEHV